MTHPSQRIVVGTDGSAGARAALRFALRDADRRGAALEVVAAFDTAETLTALCGSSTAPIAGATDDIREAVLKETTRLVEDVCAEVTAELGHLPDVTVTVMAGSAAPVLLQASHGADLLVVGSRGRGGFASMVLGSVGLQCVLHATCPVTVVPPSAG
jgi:nucleotide-binding universal stress UspA family protein